MAKLLTTSTTFGILAGHLAGRDQKTIGNNTVLRDAGPGAIAVRLHCTDLVTVLADGTLTLNSGGYWTTTTKDRLNSFLRTVGARVHANRWQWYLTTADGVETEWQDGLQLDSEGRRI